MRANVKARRARCKVGVRVVADARCYTGPATSPHSRHTSTTTLSLRHTGGRARSRIVARRRVQATSVSSSWHAHFPRHRGRRIALGVRCRRRRRRRVGQDHRMLCVRVPRHSQGLEQHLTTITYARACRATRGPPGARADRHHGCRPGHRACRRRYCCCHCHRRERKMQRLRERLPRGSLITVASRRPRSLHGPARDCGVPLQGNQRPLQRRRRRRRQLRRACQRAPAPCSGGHRTTCRIRGGSSHCGKLMRVAGSPPALPPPQRGGALRGPSPRLAAAAPTDSGSRAPGGAASQVVVVVRTTVCLPVVNQTRAGGHAVHASTHARTHARTHAHERTRGTKVSSSAVTTQPSGLRRAEPERPLARPRPTLPTTSRCPSVASDARKNGADNASHHMPSTADTQQSPLFIAPCTRKTYLQAAT